jgi:type VI secretion system protein ImpA
MPSPHILDVEPLLAPIPGDNPAGADVQYDGTHDAIREARRSDDDLDQGEWVRETKTADWQGVIELSTQALTTRSKDLQIACWLTEALAKRHGFTGLRDGMALLAQLLERFWESCYPTIDDDDLEGRAAPLVWLNDKLPASIRQIPLTQGINGERYAWLQWQESREVDNLGRRDQAAMAAAMAEGKISGEQFDKAVETTPLSFQQTLLEDLNQLWQSYEQLDQCAETRFSREAPSLLGVKAAIQDCRTLVTEIVKRRGGLTAEPEPKPAVVQAPEAVSPAVAPAVAAPSQWRPRPEGLTLEPVDRADALRRLSAIADYFRKAEPHSPVAYLVQRAVRWGEMPLEQWLQDVIRDEGVLGHLRETLGIKDSAGDSAG